LYNTTIFRKSNVFYLPGSKEAFRPVKTGVRRADNRMKTVDSGFPGGYKSTLVKLAGITDKEA